MTRWTRRGLLAAGAATPAVGLVAQAAEADEAVIIRASSRDGGARVVFDPIGVHVPVGARIRWRVTTGVHTVTAIHPANGDWPRGIPAGAEAWDSGYVQPGDTFEWRLTVPGVYDYLCKPHAAAGMAGRIVVGNPERTPQYDAADNLPPAVRETLPAVAPIRGATGKPHVDSAPS